MARYQNKTTATEVSPREFLSAVEPAQRRLDGLALLDFFGEVTGWRPRMWGPSIVGFGSYDYVYDSGHSGTAAATGFSPRKENLVLYIMPGYQDYGSILARLGKHRLGKACLYLNRLSDVDTDVLAELVRRGLADLGKIHPVKGS